MTENPPKDLGEIAEAASHKKPLLGPPKNLRPLKTIPHPKNTHKRSDPGGKKEKKEADLSLKFIQKTTIPLLHKFKSSDLLEIIPAREKTAAHPGKEKNPTHKQNPLPDSLHGLSLSFLLTQRQAVRPDHAMDLEQLIAMGANVPIKTGVQEEVVADKTAATISGVLGIQVPETGIIHPARN